MFFYQTYEACEITLMISNSCHTSGSSQLAVWAYKFGHDLGNMVHEFSLNFYKPFCTG